MIRRILSRFQKDYKQVILVRADLKLPKGKMAVQVAHASVDCTLNSTRKKVMNWKRGGMKKIALKVADLEELKNFHVKAKDAGLVTSLISDAGHTTVKPGTITVCGIGPDTEEKINELTSELKMV